MIDRVERLVLNYRRSKVAELASECGISNGSVYNIIHEHLAMAKVSARWLPRKPEHTRSSAKDGVKSRTSGSAQCIPRRLFNSSRNSRLNMSC